MGRHGGAKTRQKWLPFVGFVLTLVVLGVLIRFIVALVGEFSNGDGMAGLLLVVAAGGVLACLVLELQFGVQLYELATGRTLDSPKSQGGRRARR